MPKEKAISILREEMEQGKLDGEVVSCLIELVTSEVPAVEEVPVPA
jgi:hypothetical protein